MLLETIITLLGFRFIDIFHQLIVFEHEAQILVLQAHFEFEGFQLTLFDGLNQALVVAGEILFGFIFAIFVKT